MDNLGWGLRITALGMGLVFGLLALLWGLLTLVQRWDRAASTALPAAVTEPAAAPAMEAALVAAIVSATLAHRAHLRREAAPTMRSHWPGSQLYASRWVAAGRTRQNQSWQRRGRP
jgi:Na+-transporting methylmalonyl-CoA/oxaloacetate decarboxylase gamma subunit